ncbi:hypothetical protein OUZ56_026545 [Daphnia magna]|uniref:Uncharacterized protein n=1 Tax=Daphnia magna TaxID=35525 RepID=A0ABQ9ZM36_9CRUS|nr:hypothetical protein OUZ56_026545 [Daphnia magna]
MRSQRFELHEGASETAVPGPAVPPLSSGGGDGFPNTFATVGKDMRRRIHLVVGRVGGRGWMVADGGPPFIFRLDRIAWDRLGVGSQRPQIAAVSP